MTMPARILARSRRRRSQAPASASGPHQRIGQPERPKAEGAPSPTWALTLALLVIVVVAGAARLAVEAPFFYRPSLFTSAGLAPVPQDDAHTPALDAALRAAASALPAASVCVITADSWNRDYFRASYLLMPRNVWPVAPLLSRFPPLVATITDAITKRGADCLLVQSGVRIPPGWRLLTAGVYASYVPEGQS